MDAYGRKGIAADWLGFAIPQRVRGVIAAPAEMVLASEVGYRGPALNLDFTIDGTTVVLNPLQLATIPTRVLGPAVGSLDGEHIRVIAALDAMIGQGQ